MQDVPVQGIDIDASGQVDGSMEANQLLPPSGIYYLLPTSWHKLLTRTTKAISVPKVGQKPDWKVSMQFHFIQENTELALAPCPNFSYLDFSMEYIKNKSYHKLICTIFAAIINPEQDWSKISLTHLMWHAKCCPVGVVPLSGGGGTDCPQTADHVESLDPPEAV